MPKYVISPDVGLHLAEHESVIGDEYQLLAPTLFRSQTLSMLYRTVRKGEITKKEADRRLTYVRALRIRLLGDRSMQQVAWRIANQLGLPDTLDAEYLALTQLQADALVTLDAELARTAKGVVPTASVKALL